MNDGVVTMVESVLGAMHLDLRPLHQLSRKRIESKFRLFEDCAVNHPLFLNPYTDQDQRIKSKKAKFEE